MDAEGYAYHGVDGCGRVLGSSEAEREALPACYKRMRSGDPPGAEEEQWRPPPQVPAGAGAKSRPAGPAWPPTPSPATRPPPRLFGPE